MPSAAESLGQQEPMRAALDAGLNLLSNQQDVVFTQYQRFALASDGFVFWVATPTTMTVSGSLHYATDRLQDEDQTIGANQVLLTAEAEVTHFNAVSPETMWIGTWPIAGGTLQVAFAQRGSYYNVADLWHYAGFAVYPALAAQLLFSPADLPAGPIVSNSLPIWLAQTQVGARTVPVYPSYLVPENLAPPYIVAHVEPQGTIALGAFPVMGPWPGTILSAAAGLDTEAAIPLATEAGSGLSSEDGSPAPFHALAASQLMRDQVTLTLYGFDNTMAWQYLSGLVDASLTGAFGFANSPAIVDEKRTQAEIAALAQKKRIAITANYYQGAADALARRLILQAMAPLPVISGGHIATLTGTVTQAAGTVSGQATVALALSAGYGQAPLNVTGSAVVG